MGMLISGIPHGAVDHLAYMHGTDNRGGFKQFLYFYVRVMGFYALLWLLLPGVSLLLFLGLSFYHFGQSQLAHIHLPERSFLKRSLYFLWGMLLLLAMIGFNWGESALILDSLGAYPGKAWINQASFGVFSYVFWALTGLNISLWVYAWGQGHFKTPSLLYELGVLCLLVALCYYCPLKIAFTIYFALWHAPQAIQAEIWSLKELSPQFDWRRFFREALPFSLLSFVGIGLLIFLSQLLKSQISPYLLFFISISILTLPHMLVMESVYQQQEVNS